MINRGLTGKASIDRPWMKYYPEQFQKVQAVKMTLERFLKMRNPDQSRYVFEYYGCRYTWTQFWEDVELAAKGLKALGFREGDRIPAFLQAVPSHYILMLAAEKIGAALICRQDTPEELCYAIRKTTATSVFVQDYLSKDDEELFRSTTQVKKLIKVSPFDYADRDKMPEYVLNEIDSRYADGTLDTEDCMTWEEFLELGRNFEGDYLVPEDPDRPLFGAYTSGSTGISKLVIHSSANVVAVAYQMSLFVQPQEKQETWWLPALPPALIAVTVALTLFPLSAGVMVILDPFCPMYDIDIQFMRYRPNYWAMMPLFCEIMMGSDRIPEDYDMSHLKSIGTGAEALNEKKSREVEAFFHKHNCMQTLSAGYGQSEGCSNFTLPNPLFPLKDGCVGMPMPATTIAVFDTDTMEELSYGEIGEICMNGPAKMLHYGGYNTADLNERALVKHADGEVWLHTGDRGYITEDGIVYILGRGHFACYGGGELYLMRMESRAVEAKGVKDGFFCNVPDLEHEGYYVPYFFVILEDGAKLEEVREDIMSRLEPHERPREIRVIERRPYSQFKTNRKACVAQILDELKAQELTK